jgi:lipoprotein NlpI
VADLPDAVRAYELFENGCRFLRERHPGQAALYLERALVLEPDKTSINEALGRAYFAMGEYDKSAAAFAAVLDLSPTNDYAHFGRGRALLAGNHAREALAAARLAAAMVPENEEYRHAVEDCLRALAVGRDDSSPSR